MGEGSGARCVQCCTSAFIRWRVRCALVQSDGGSMVGYAVPWVARSAGKGSTGMKSAVCTVVFRGVLFSTVVCEVVCEVCTVP